MKSSALDRKSSLPAALLLCVFLSGAAGLIYQVAWSKALGLIFGHAVYAIATVLAAFGSTAESSCWSRRRARYRSGD